MFNVLECNESHNCKYYYGPFDTREEALAEATLAMNDNARMSLVGTFELIETVMVENAVVKPIRFGAFVD